jgi:hypothetical protein
MVYGLYPKFILFIVLLKFSLSEDRRHSVRFKYNQNPLKFRGVIRPQTNSEIIKMEQSKYEKIGNLGEYIHEQRIVRPIDLITTPKLVLKYYGMCGEGESFKGEHINQYKELMNNEIGNGHIKPLSGLGFAILSGDMINLAVWDKENPIILKNQIYSHSEEGVRETLNLNTEGAFCIWELGIVNFERNEWMKYLQSEKKEADKIKYLNSTLEGLL